MKINNGNWFNAPSTDPQSCCALIDAVNEFNIQGLELDMPIVAWGLDMIWKNGEWLKFKQREDKNSESNTYRRNSYRVLLTRGRDGFIIFVPSRYKQLDQVYNLFVKVGIKELNEYM